MLASSSDLRVYVASSSSWDCGEAYIIVYAQTTVLRKQNVKNNKYTAASDKCFTAFILGLPDTHVLGSDLSDMLNIMKGS
jgi:hypothetical protein